MKKSNEPKKFRLIRKQNQMRLEKQLHYKKRRKGKYKSKKNGGKKL